MFKAHELKKLIEGSREITVEGLKRITDEVNHNSITDSLSLPKLRRSSGKCLRPSLRVIELSICALCGAAVDCLMRLRVSLRSTKLMLWIARVTKGYQ